jgi:hypothetical protein
MADFTVLNRELIEPHVGQRGYRELIGAAAFSTTDLTGTLDVTPLQFVDNVHLILGSAPASGVTDITLGDLGTVSASAAFLMRMPSAGTITGARFIVDTTVATDAANIWTVGVINTTATLTPVDIAVAANSNNSTGGTAFTADVPRALTLGAAGQLVVVAGDVLEWTFTKAASAPNLVELTGSISISTGAGVETLYVTIGANGLVAITSNKITIGRSAITPTSGLRFGFRIRGR